MKQTPLSFCLIICSRRRPELVIQALEAISNLIIPAEVRFSVLLVENDITPQYADIVASFRRKIPIHYETEPEPGLTYVRNHALSSAEKLEVDWIGSIDDDVIIPKDWLVHMVSAINTYPDTQIFYGNWIRHNHPDEPKWHPSAHQINSRPTGRKIKVSSFNNIAVRVDVFAQDGMALEFDHRFRYIGGEDHDFTRSFLKRGGIIRSVREAVAEEYNSPERADLSDRLARVVAAEYTNEVVRHKHDTKIIATLWSLQMAYRGLVLGGANIIIGAIIYPFSTFQGLKHFAEGRSLFARARGVYRYYFGSDPERYRDDNV